MAYSDAGRRSNPLFIVSAVGVFLFGLGILVVSVNTRLQVNRIPTGAEELWEKGYGDLLTTTVTPVSRQQIVVTKGELLAGDEILPEFLELRPAQWVVEKFPEFEVPGARGHIDRDLVTGLLENLDDAAGMYALIDIPTGTPLTPELLARSNPYRNRQDDGRQNRVTVAAPPEPSLYGLSDDPVYKPLLSVGDRVDVFIVVGGNSIRQTIRNCRVVAMDNIVTQDSGLLSRAEEAKYSAIAEAALRKKRLIEAQQQRAGAETPPAEPTGEESPDQPAEATADTETPPANDQPPPAQQDVPEGAVVLERPKFDGRTITLQVSREESMVLAMANNLPGAWIDLALHPRPRR